MNFASILTSTLGTLKDNLSWSALSFDWQLIVNMWHDYIHALNDWHLLHPLALWLMPVGIWAALFWGKRQISIKHSTLDPHQNLMGWRGLTGRWSALLAVSYVCLLGFAVNLDLAMTVPTVPEASQIRLAKTRFVCIQKDSSGSMLTELLKGMAEKADQDAAATNDPSAVKVDNGGAEKFVVQDQVKEQPKELKTRSDWATEVALYFIKRRMTMDLLNTDQVCLQRFDMDTYMVAPFSADKIALEMRVNHLNENVGGGTNFGGPTGFVTDVGPLQFAYDYFVHERKLHPDATFVDIMVTDGYDAIDPERRKELEDLFVAFGIKFYVIGLGDGWSDPTKPLDLEKFAKELNKADPKSGFVFRASEPGEMKRAMQKIDENEQHEEMVKTVQTHREVDDAFIAAALAFYLLYLVFASLAGRNP
ncbi:MAG: hypothetical protein P4L53_06455 [Candidatus Obscuribacterales bacterium]|nr:hypothetical protein [Candidatus Obscuribacterales bacterium]